MELSTLAVSATGYLVHKVVSSHTIIDPGGKKLVIRPVCRNLFYFGKTVEEDDTTQPRCSRCFPEN